MANATVYQPGSITSFLAAASVSDDKPSSSSKKTKLQALFDKPNVSYIPRKQIQVDHKRKQNASETDAAAVKVSNKKRKREMHSDDGGSKLVFAREEGLRNADVKEMKPKKRFKKVIVATTEEATAEGELMDKSTDLAKNSDSARKRIESKATPKKSGYVRPSEPKKDQRTVFVGNVALTVNKKMLMKMFKACGTVESVRIRSVPVSTLKMPKRASAITKEFHPQRHNMNAYVMFDTREAAQKSLKFNGAELEGLHIRVDLADVDKKKHDHKRSIFIGNISYQVEEEALRGHFADCGDIDNVRIIRDPKTGMGKGFGYITFQDASSVDLAILLNGDSLRGRELRIHRSLEKPPSSSEATTSQRGNKYPSKKITPSSGKSAVDKTSMPSSDRRAPLKKSTYPDRSDDRAATWKRRNVAGVSQAEGKSKVEAKSEKRLRKKEIRRKSREMKKLSLGRLLTGVKKLD